MSGYQSHIQQVFEGQHQQCDMGITFLRFSACQMLRGGGVGVGQKKKSVLFFYHTYPANMCAHLRNAGNRRRRTSRERGTVVRRSKPHVFFVSYMCFLSQLRSNLRVARCEKEKTTHTHTHNLSPHQQRSVRRRRREGWALFLLLLFMLGIVCVHFLL